MENNPLSENQKNLGALMHLSTFTKYLFPFANFFVPLILWTSNKEKPFAREHGRQAINFQLSIFVYVLALLLICLPFFLMYITDFILMVDQGGGIYTSDFQHLKNITGFIVLIGLLLLVCFGLFVIELYAVINATMHAASGKLYKYPLCINFIKEDNFSKPTINNTTNEHSS
jgi:uncharacterized protein